MATSTPSSSSSSSSSSLPGPWKLPLVGNIYHLPSLIMLPKHRSLAYLSGKYTYHDEGVFTFQAGLLPLVIVSSPEAARKVLNGDGFLDRFESSTIQTFSYDYSNVVFSPHGDHWQKIRKIFKDVLLNKDRVKTFKGIRETQSANLVDSIAKSAGEEIDISEKIFGQMMSITFASAFGDGEESRKILGEFQKEMKFVSSLSGGLNLSDMLSVWPRWVSVTAWRAYWAHTRLDKMLVKIIDGCAQESSEDDEGGSLSLIDELLKGRGNFELTREQIKPVILDVFMAGTETAAATIEWVMSELMKNPDIMQRAQSEIRELVARASRSSVEEDDVENLPFLDSIIKETLRLHPPFPLIARQASKDSDILGLYRIPHKTRVLVNIWAIGRDPLIWTDPLTFKPERFDEVRVNYENLNNKYAFIPFGAGLRVCPGKWFGEASFKLTLANLLFHFNWELPNGMTPEGLDMDEAKGAVTFRKNPLRLVATALNQPQVPT